MNTKPNHSTEFLQQYIPVREAAKLIGYTCKTLENWEKSGAGPKRHRIESFSYYDRAEFNVYAHEITERNKRKQNPCPRKLFALSLPRHLAEFLVRNHKAQGEIEELTERLYSEARA